MRTLMINQLRNGAVLSSLFLATCLSAAAQSPVDLGQFDAVDLNGDACVDWEELRNGGSIVFHSLDRNGDGRLAGEELVSSSADQQNANLPPVEADAFQVQLRIAFEAGDADSSGCLSAEEFAGM